MLWLKDRQIIEIFGDDSQDFLQGIITNDIKLLTNQNLIYTAFLNASGRFYADFFIFKSGHKFLIDCHQSQSDDIIKKFTLYKLRSKIEIQKNYNFKVIFNTQNIGYADPRNKNFGYRFYDEGSALEEFEYQNSLYYHQRRIEFKIPEGIYDLLKEKSFIAEYDFDNLNAVSYQKGCYLGQETTARNHYRGAVRKKLFIFEIHNINDLLLDYINSVYNLNSLQIDDKNLKFIKVNNIEILITNQTQPQISSHEVQYFELEGSKAQPHESRVGGLMLSAIFNQQKRSMKGLALVKIDENNSNLNQNLSVFDNKILIIN